MKAQTYRPRVQNGQVARRQSRPATVRATAQSVGRRRGGSSRVAEQAVTRSGARVLGTIIVIGTVIAAGFLLALQSQLNINQIGQKDAELKAEFYEMANRQRVETLRQQQALSDAEAAVLTQKNGLLQPRLSRGAPASREAAPRAATPVIKVGKVVKVVKTRKASSPRRR